MDIIVLAKDRLRHGETYPYDAPGKWWRGLSEAPPPPSTDWAHKAARGVLADLYDRSGFDDAIGRDNVDDETRVDIIQSIAQIIRQAAIDGGVAVTPSEMDELRAARHRIVAVRLALGEDPNV